MYRPIKADANSYSDVEYILDHYPMFEIFGYHVENKDLTSEEMRDRFKKNIIDYFIENETFVVYH